LLTSSARAENITLNKCYLNKQTDSYDFLIDKNLLEKDTNFKDSSWSSKSWEKTRIQEGTKVGNYLWAKEILPESMSYDDFMSYRYKIMRNDDRNHEKIVDAFVKKYKLNYSILRIDDAGVIINTKNSIATFYLNFSDEYVVFNLKKYETIKKWWKFHKDKGIELKYGGYVEQYGPDKPFVEKNYTHNVKVTNLAGSNILTLAEERQARMWHPELYKFQWFLTGQLITGQLKELGRKGTTIEINRSIDLKKKSYEETITTTDLDPPSNEKSRSHWEKFRNRTEINQYLCTTPGSKSGINSYLDYWWALVLIAGIIFFIYTQTGKEFNIQNQFKIEKILKLFTYLKFKKAEKKNKTNKKDSSKKEDFKDYLG
jgi:hypothetical protein